MLLMNVSALFNFIRVLALFLGLAAFTLAFVYMYATEAKKPRGN